jgi:hypothetical protein
VPMLTCGLVRWNLALATEAPSSLFATLFCGALLGLLYGVGRVWSGLSVVDEPS